MMTSSNGNIVRVAGPLCGEFTGHRWIPRTEALWRGVSMFYSICARINASVNNREAGNLRRHRAHYDVIVMNITFLGSGMWTNSNHVVMKKENPRKIWIIQIYTLFVQHQQITLIMHAMLIINIITVTSWASYCLKILTTRLFVQEPDQTIIKGNMKAPHYYPFCDENPALAGGFPIQRANNAKKVSMPWHLLMLIYVCFLNLWHIYICVCVCAVNLCYRCLCVADSIAFVFLQQCCANVTSVRPVSK